jgi:predicted nuclease of predicted toxin-antitoxin system
LRLDEVQAGENFGTRTQQIFRTSGHDVLTVRDQQLQGCSDQRLYEMCCAEHRCLVTLDLDFSDVLRFPPQEAHGIVVIRAPHNPTLSLLEALIRQFLKFLETMPVEKKLLIVETGRVRIHQAEDAADEIV